jgi:endoglucanase Acf2
VVLQAVNSYFGCYLYGLAAGDNQLTPFAQAMLTMEVQAAQTYWHMSSDSVYDEIFAANRMAGTANLNSCTHVFRI